MIRYGTLALFSFTLVMNLSHHVQAQLPNIVILYADDMGYGDLACQNPQSKIPTPNLDRLASQGMRFTNAHSSSGVCTPSRYALLHGRYHWRKFHGIVNSFDQPILDDERITLAELLKSKGYATGCIGKWHLGWDWNAIKRSSDTANQPDNKGKAPVEDAAKKDPARQAGPTGDPARQAGPTKAGPTKSTQTGTAQAAAGFASDAFDWSKPIPGGPLSHGFDYYFGDDVPNFPPYAWFENDRVITVPTVPLATPKETAEGNWEARPGPSVKDWDFWAVMPTLTDKAVEWINRQDQQQPFFLYFPFTSPHAPIVPTDDFVGKSKAGGYGDFMFQTDDTVGRVLKALDEKGLADNTIVIFSADNGPESYAYERVRKFDHRSMGPLRGLKRDIYEGGHRVPMIIRWPKVVTAGSVNDGLLSQIDAYATIARITNSEIPQLSAEDSFNQLNMLQGRASARDSLVHNTNANGYAIRQGDWVLIEAKSGYVSKVPEWFEKAEGYSAHSGSGELYNLRDDLAQKKNMFEQQPDRVAQMRQLLGKIRERGL
jgi:arylsulfatase A